MTSVWAPSQIDQLAAEHISTRRKRQNVKAERLVKCLSFAAEQGGDFWAVIGKALEQVFFFEMYFFSRKTKVINDFNLPPNAKCYLRSLQRGEIKLDIIQTKLNR